MYNMSKDDMDIQERVERETAHYKQLMKEVRELYEESERLQEYATRIAALILEKRDLVIEDLTAKGKEWSEMRDIYGYIENADSDFIEDEVPFIWEF